MNTKLQWSQANNEDSKQRFVIFVHAPLDFELEKGMATCQQCGAYIPTPNNVIPASFTAAHPGHTIAVRLAEE